MKKLLILLTLLLASTGSAAIYSSCAEAAKYGESNIPRSSVFYSANLDRDKDGIACESSGDDTYSPILQPFYLPKTSGSTGTVSAGNAPAIQLIYGPASPVSPDATAMKVYRVVQVVSSTRVILNFEYRDFTAELIGPEMSLEQAAQAHAWLARMLPVSSLVYVEEDKLLPGTGQVLPVYLWMDQQLVNAQMISAGLATARDMPTKYLSFFRAAQISAQEQAIGIWRK